MSIVDEINERIFSLMKERGVSGYKIMKDLKIPQGTISQARHNKASFTVSQLVKISEYFKVSLDYLIIGKEFDDKTLNSKMKELISENNDLHGRLKKINATIALFDKVKDIVSRAK